MVAGTEWGVEQYAFCTALCSARIATPLLTPESNATWSHVAQGSVFFRTSVRVAGRCSRGAR